MCYIIKLNFNIPIWILNIPKSLTGLGITGAGVGGYIHHSPTSAI